MTLMKRHPWIVWPLSLLAALFGMFLLPVGLTAVSFLASAFLYLLWNQRFLTGDMVSEVPSALEIHEASLGAITGFYWIYALGSHGKRGGFFLVASNFLLGLVNVRPVLDVLNSADDLTALVNVGPLVAWSLFLVVLGFKLILRQSAKAEIINLESNPPSKF